MASQAINGTQDSIKAREDEFKLCNPCDVCTILFPTTTILAFVLNVLSINHNIYAIFVLLFINCVMYQVIQASSCGIAMLRNVYCTKLKKINHACYLKRNCEQSKNRSKYVAHYIQMLENHLNICHNIKYSK